MSSQPKPASPGGAKRPFVTPKLRVYGTVGEITASVDRGGPPDGSGHPKNNMTTPPGQAMMG